MINEEKIAELCATGDNNARRILYEEYSSPLMGIAVRYMGSRETAEDVLHDAFLHIFSVIHQFKYRGSESLKAWLSRIMVNQCIEQLRLKAKNPEVATDEIPDVADDDGDINEVPPNILMKFVNELPDGYRTVFNLFVFEQLSHKEIGKLLNINEHSSSSQYYRAKNILIKRIKDYKNGK